MNIGHWHRVLGAAALVLLVAGCGASADRVISAEARPILERLQSAPIPEAWSFDYVPLSASPYVSCLNGVDQVSGVIDLQTDAIRLQPDRVAPPLLATNTLLLVEESDGIWGATSISEFENDSLEELFGQIVAGYLATGTRAPDPNLTVLALAEVAIEITVTDPPRGFEGETIAIRLDPAKYAAEVEAVDSTVPQVRATIDPTGNVTALIVEAEANGETHADGYVLRIEMLTGGDLVVPGAEQQNLVAASDVRYPDPTTSCRF